MDQPRRHRILEKLASRWRSLVRSGSLSDRALRDLKTVESYPYVQPVRLGKELIDLTNPMVRARLEAGMREGTNPLSRAKFEKERKFLEEVRDAAKAQNIDVPYGWNKPRKVWGDAAAFDREIAGLQKGNQNLAKKFRVDIKEPINRDLSGGADPLLESSSDMSLLNERPSDRANYDQLVGLGRYRAGTPMQPYVNLAPNKVTDAIRSMSRLGESGITFTQKEAPSLYRAFQALFKRHELREATTGLKPGMMSAAGEVALPTVAKPRFAQMTSADGTVKQVPISENIISKTTDPRTGQSVYDFKHNSPSIIREEAGHANMLAGRFGPEGQDVKQIMTANRAPQEGALFSRTAPQGAVKPVAGTTPNEAAYTQAWATSPRIRKQWDANIFNDPKNREAVQNWNLGLAPTTNYSDLSPLK